MPAASVLAVFTLLTKLMSRSALSHVEAAVDFRYEVTTADMEGAKLSQL